MIPLLLSQTWKSSNLPHDVAALVSTWRELNPEFSYRLYDDAGCRQVIADTVPEHLADYDRLPLPVMRADVFRYAVIYRDGGLYADIDMECLRPVAAQLKGHNILVAEEAHLTSWRQHELHYRKPVQFANCIFAAEPRHEILLAAVRRSFELFMKAREVTRATVEDITGPRMLTRLIYSWAGKPISVLPQVVWMSPLHYPNVWPLNANMHARHRTFGTWKGAASPLPFQRRLIERNRWPNPFLRQPYALDGQGRAAAR